MRGPSFRGTNCRARGGNCVPPRQANARPPRDWYSKAAISAWPGHIFFARSSPSSIPIQARKSNDAHTPDQPVNCARPIESERIAALPMYDYPELAPAHDALWAALADRLIAAGVSDPPLKLTRT